MVADCDVRGRHFCHYIIFAILGAFGGICVFASCLTCKNIFAHLKFLCGPLSQLDQTQRTLRSHVIPSYGRPYTSLKLSFFMNLWTALTVHLCHFEIVTRNLILWVLNDSRLWLFALDRAVLLNTNLCSAVAKCLQCKC
jgi:hypothetical protein